MVICARVRNIRALPLFTMEYSRVSPVFCSVGQLSNVVIWYQNSDIIRLKYIIIGIIGRAWWYESVFKVLYSKCSLNQNDFSKLSEKWMKTRKSIEKTYQFSFQSNHQGFKRSSSQHWWTIFGKNRTWLDMTGPKLYIPSTIYKHLNESLLLAVCWQIRPSSGQYWKFL